MATQQAKKVAVTEPAAEARAYDYADAFEVRLPEPRGVEPRVWVRAGFQAVPKWIVKVATLGEKPDPAAEFPHWTVAEAGPDLLRLEQSDALMDVVFVGRNVGSARTLTTILYFRKPLAARLAWSVIGPLHRRTARRMLDVTAGD